MTRCYVRRFEVCGICSSNWELIFKGLYKGSFTVNATPVPCPHIPSVKGGWPHTAAILPTQRGGKAGRSSRTGLGDRLNKGKDG